MGLPEVDEVKPSEWFQESGSGGPHAAWQTFYPAAPSLQPDGPAPPAWRKDAVHSGYVQAFARGTVSIHSGEPLNKDAQWFDDSVAQYDAFGRARAPSQASDRFYAGWQERLLNTTLKCPTPGCMANASLQVVDVRQELHHGCVLGIAVHPTDYADEFSQEVVEWFIANDEIVNKRCNPKISGCQASEAAQLFPCAADVNVDDILAPNGTLALAGKLSPMVDECPFEGNLLSAVVTVRCLISPRPKHEDPPKPAKWQLPPPPPNETRFNATLSCKEPGCEAHALIALAPPSANSTCVLNISLNQTDFDGKLGDADGITEEVEWVKIDGQEVKSHAKPGHNPCKEAVDRGPNDTSAASMHLAPFLLVRSEDVTHKAMRGPFNVSVKISAMVDECGTPEGDLLHATVVVVCNANLPVAAANTSGEGLGGETTGADSGKTADEMGKGAAGSEDVAGNVEGQQLPTLQPLPRSGEEQMHTAAQGRGDIGGVDRRAGRVVDLHGGAARVPSENGSETAAATQAAAVDPDATSDSLSVAAKSTERGSGSTSMVPSSPGAEGGAPAARRGGSADAAIVVGASEEAVAAAKRHAGDEENRRNGTSVDSQVASAGAVDVSNAAAGAGGEASSSQPLEGSPASESKAEDAQKEFDMRAAGASSSVAGDSDEHSAAAGAERERVENSGATAAPGSAPAAGFSGSEVSGTRDAALGDGSNRGTSLRPNVSEESAAEDRAPELQ